MAGVVLEKRLNELFVKKAPVQIPAGGKEVIAKLVPWVDLVLFIFHLPALLVIFAIISTLGEIASAVGETVSPLYYVSLLFLLIRVVLIVVAVPGLFRRTRGGWTLLYYAALASIVYALADWANTPAQIFSLTWALAAAVIALYILFQIRDLYRN